MASPATAPPRDALDGFHFHCSASSSRFARQRVSIHEASFQAHKMSNEDRIARLQTSYGFLVAIFDGHYEDLLSQYASKHLLNDVDRRVSHSLENPDGVPDCIRDAIMDFDKALVERAETRLRESVSKPFAEWDADDVWKSLQVDGEKAMGEDDPYPVMRRACVGSTVFLCVVMLGDTEHRMWTASLGDSEGFLGSSSRAIVAINELHNTTNALEVERLLREHPNEENVLEYRRVKGQLLVTRALGDAILKVPIDFAQALSIMWGATVFPQEVANWVETPHTPPYISSTPSIKAFVVHKGDTLILASDGLRQALEDKGIPSDAIGDTTFCLAGLGAAPKSSIESTLGYSLIPPSQNSNVAEIIIQNALFGTDENMKTLEITAGAECNLQDDISVVVVQFDKQ